MDIAIDILLVVVAYLLGSISNAIWIGKRFYGIDVRQYGSRNAGATNVLRTLGWKAALPVFLLDMLKGVLAVLLVRFTTYIPDTNPCVGYQIALGAAVFIGHIFPIFARFKGGKGVATMTGVLLSMHPYALLIAFAVWLLVFLPTRYVSLSSICASIAFPIAVIVVFGMFLDPAETLTMKIFSIAMCLIIIHTHRTNIKRLMKGEESKTVFKKRVEPPPKAK
ncbi:MAG: glycerol-3-phosphate 1-O-acyltransferase PlsY [Prevotellaceae bacterium]|jgi:glycerol-3-phosphate acyltransferase PlsY|nr:glycerol-3-phosphate 1-O-acyltransferase PlsY [Prevotellaceae bacterium]